MSVVQLQQTPLYQEHLNLKAKMVPFGGWSMPVQYGQGIIAEYQQARNGVTVFDTSHMGEFFVCGDSGATGLDRLVTQRLFDLPLKSCRYGLLTNEQGGVIDDLIVYRLEEDRWMIVVNAGTIAGDEKHFTSGLTLPESFTNRSREYGKLDIQGPGSRDCLASFIDGLQKLDYYTFDYFDVLGERAIVSRTGYTGELGFEIYFPWEKTPELWRRVIAAGAVPAGLGVRDLLRIEMGYPLYGHELTADRSPLPSGLARFIDWDKDFIGRAALLKAKEAPVEKRLVSLLSESRRSPRAGMPLIRDGKEVGEVSSGTFSPHFGRGVGLGFVAVECGQTDTELLAGKGANAFAVHVVKRPIYQQGSLKN